MSFSSDSVLFNFVQIYSFAVTQNKLSAKRPFLFSDFFSN